MLSRERLMLDNERAAIESLESEKHKLMKRKSEIRETMELPTANINFCKDQLSTIDLEIYEIDKEIESRTRHLEEREKFESLSEKEKNRIRREKEEKRQEEKQKLQESLKKSAYRKLKKAYKTLPLSDRIFSRLPISRIKSPRWKQVKNLSLEEMQFILDLKTGSTLQQEREYDQAKECLKKSVSHSEIKKHKLENQQRDFRVALSNKNRLKEKMEREESLKAAKREGRSL